MSAVVMPWQQRSSAGRPERRPNNPVQARRESVGGCYGSADIAQLDVWAERAFNGTDFQRLALPTSPRVVIPPDPPDIAL